MGDGALSVMDVENRVSFSFANSEMSSFATNAFHEFNRIRRNALLCDITIISHDRLFYAHKVILSASIPYFYTMFTCGLSESKQSKIFMNEYDADIIELIINYAYTGSVQLTDDNFCTILNVAFYMQINFLIQKCKELFQKFCTIKNIFRLLEIGNVHYDQDIIDFTSKFLRVNFAFCCQTDEYLKLSATNVGSIIKNDELHVNSEDEILDAVVRWICHDPTNRVAHAHELFQHVRLALVSLPRLMDAMDNSALKQSAQCSALLKQALKYQKVPHERVLLPAMNLSERNCSDVPGVIYALGGYSWPGSSSAVEFYDPLANQWIAASDMPSARSRFGVAVLKRKLYAIGGSAGLNRLPLVEVFDADTNTWSRKPDLLYRRSATATAVANDTIFVCGGFNGQDALTTVESYRPEWRTWVLRQPLLYPRSAAAAAALNGQIYVIGGHNNAVIYHSVEVLNLETQQWELGVRLPSPRCRHGAATTLDDEICIAGGYDGVTFLNSAMMFNPVKMKWLDLAPMNINRSRVSLVTTNGLIYAIGGHNEKSNITSMEIYDSRENKWHMGPGMKVHEGGVSVGVIPVSSNVLTL